MKISKNHLIELIKEELDSLLSEKNQPYLYHIYTWDAVSNLPVSKGLNVYKYRPHGDEFPTPKWKKNIRPLYRVGILQPAGVLGIKPLLNLSHEDFPPMYRKLHTGKDKIYKGYVVVTKDDKRISDIFLSPDELNVVDGEGGRLPRDAYGRPGDKQMLDVASEASKRYIAQQKSKEGPPEEFVPKLKATGNEKPEVDPLKQRMMLKTKMNTAGPPKKYVSDLKTSFDQ